MAVIVGLALAFGFFLWCGLYESVIVNITKPWKYILLHVFIGPFGWCVLLVMLFMQILSWTTLDKKFINFFTS